MPSSECLARGPFKLQALRLLRRRNIPISTIIDVGVLNETPELIEIFPDLYHVLVEPVAEFNEKIAQAYRNVPYVIFNAAACATDGIGRLETVSVIDGVEISHASLVPDQRVIEGRTYRDIEALTLDTIVDRSGASGPFLLKIDVDGGELDVLKGASRTLLDTSVVIIEIFRDEMGKRLVALSDAGFDLFDLVEPVYYDSCLWQCDAIFIRRDLHKRAFKGIDQGVEPDLYSMFTEWSGRE